MSEQRYATGLGSVITVQISTGNHWPSFGIIAMPVSRPIQSTEFVHRDSCQSSLARDNSCVTPAPPKACFLAWLPAKPHTSITPGLRPFNVREPRVERTRNVQTADTESRPHFITSHGEEARRLAHRPLFPKNSCALYP